MHIYSLHDFKPFAVATTAALKYVAGGPAIEAVTAAAAAVL